VNSDEDVNLLLFILSQVALFPKTATS